MKQRKWIGILLLAALLPGVLTGCAVRGKKEIAVIVKATDSDFWHSVRSGVDSAATEYNVSVTFEGPDNEEDYAAQNQLIADAVARGADAIVLSAIDYDRSADIVTDAARKGVQVVTIDSGVNSPHVGLFIGTDNTAAGEAAGKAAVRSVAAGCVVRIGLVNYYQRTDNGIRREEGFRAYIDTVADAEIVESVNVDSNTESAAAAAAALLQAHPEINVLVGFNEWMTLGVGEAIRQSEAVGRVHGIGFDTNLTSVGMLETGEMDALIVQNPFAIGYLGVKSAVDCINGEPPADKSLFTDVTTVTKQNLFDPDIQKQVFRFN